MDRKHFTQKLVILLVLFFGYMGFAIALPIFPPLFLKDTFDFVPHGTSDAMRKILLGTALSAYPLGQFIGSPLIGRISDRVGRKPVLYITLFLVGVGFFFTGWSIHVSSLTLLYVTRFISGLLGGNIVTANAAMTDISKDPEEKKRNFGWITSFASSAFLIGPLIGGRLADPDLVSWFSVATPFWFAATLLVISSVFTVFWFEETKTEQADTSHKIHQIFPSLRKVMKIDAIRYIYSANFFFYLSFFFFLGYLPVLLVEKFNYTIQRIADLEAYLSIPILLAPFTFSLYPKSFTIKNFLFLATIGFFCSQILYLLLQYPIAFWFTVIPLGYFLALGFSFASVCVSNEAPPHLQGEALGYNQSVAVAAEIIASLLGGFIVAFHLYLPFIVGSITTVCAFFIYKTRVPERKPHRLGFEQKES